MQKFKKYSIFFLLTLLVSRVVLTEPPAVPTGETLFPDEVLAPSDSMPPNSMPPNDEAPNATLVPPLEELREITGKESCESAIEHLDYGECGICLYVENNQLMIMSNTAQCAKPEDCPLSDEELLKKIDGFDLDLSEFQEFAEKASCLPSAPPLSDRMDECDTFIRSTPQGECRCCTSTITGDELCTSRCAPGSTCSNVKDVNEKGEWIGECSSKEEAICSDSKRLCGVTTNGPVCCSEGEMCGISSENYVPECGAQSSGSIEECPKGQAYVYENGEWKCSPNVCSHLIVHNEKHTDVYYHEGVCYKCASDQLFDRETLTCKEKMCTLNGEQVPGEICGGECCPYGKSTCYRNPDTSIIEGQTGVCIKGRTEIS